MYIEIQIISQSHQQDRTEINYPECLRISRVGDDNGIKSVWQFDWGIVLSKDSEENLAKMIVHDIEMIGLSIQLGKCESIFIIQRTSFGCLWQVIVSDFNSMFDYMYILWTFALL